MPSPSTRHETNPSPGIVIWVVFWFWQKTLFGIFGGWFLGKNLEKNGKVSHFTSLHLQNFVWGQKKSLYKDLEIWGNSSNLFFLGGGNSNIFGIFTPILGEDEPILTSIFFTHEMISLGSVVVAMAVASDAAVDVADAMVEAVRQAVETTLQKLG